jgi:hypothetical protein
VRSRQYDGIEVGRRHRPTLAEAPKVAVEHGLVVEDTEGRFCGAIVAYEKGAVTLEDRQGKRRVFPLAPGAFLLDGKRVTLTPPVTPPAGQAARRTASGSVAAPTARAKVARASRIYVEGKHDAELVEKIWGDDLRRLGVLVDHLVAGSKESRIAAGVTSPHVLVVGHRFIDIWAAVRPSAVGILAWPQVPRGLPWKEGVLAAIGWQLEPAQAWRRILRSVSSYADLEPELLGRVEELIDFVTATGDE